MYTETLTENKIFCSEKMVLKIVFLLMALAVFSIQDVPMNAYDTGNTLKGYIQKNTIYKEQSNDALFLFEKQWNERIKTIYAKYPIQKIDDGVIYVSIVKYINSKRVKINLAEINRNINKNIEIIPKTSSNNIHSKSKIKEIASKNNTLIAINGTYFKQDTGTPLGTLVINNEIISGPIYDRVGLGISQEGFTTSRISFEGTINTKSAQIKIDNINQPRMLFSQVLLYTPKWGNTSPLTKRPALHIAVKNNKIIEKSDKPINIPKDGFVITAPVEIFRKLNTGDKIDISYKLNPSWENIKHIISGGPYLIKEDKIYIDTESEKLSAISGRNPRTAIGYTKDNIFIMVTVDGRKEGSSGMTLKELATFMKSLGCYEAINLDGGSSTVMYADGKIYTGSNVKSSTSISNILAVIKKQDATI